MHGNPAISIALGVQSLNFGTRSQIHRGWEEFKPKRYHPEKAVQSLLLRHMSDLKENDLKIAVFCGAAEFNELQRIQSFQDFPVFVTSSLQDDLFWQVILSKNENWIIAVVGSPTLMPRTTQQMRYLEAIRALFPTWYRPLREFITQTLPNLRETSLHFSPVLLQERPGRFFLPQIYEKTLKHIRKLPPMQLSETKDQLPFFDMTNRSGWGLASVFKHSDDSARERSKLDSALLDVSGLWHEMDTFADVVKEVGSWLESRQVHIQAVKKIVMANLHQETQGILAAYLRKYFNVSASVLEFPDLLWGAHSLATACEFLLDDVTPRLLIQGHGQDKMRLVLMTKE